MQQHKNPHTYKQPRSLSHTHDRSAHSTYSASAQARHISVLAKPVLEVFRESLESKPNAIFIDCTLGLGGHSSLIAKSHPHIKLIGIDQDTQALQIARENLAPYNPTILHANFAQGFAQALQIATTLALPVAGILADIGVSSLQLDSTARGFGFKSDRLDMRMDSTRTYHASSVLRSTTEFELATILQKYGEIPESKKMARVLKEFANTQACDENGFYNARALSEFIQHHFPRHKGIHPATLAFQALRIEVNDELGVLRALLEAIAQAHDMPESPLKGAVVGIISFHSLEDRIVKECLKSWGKSCKCPESAMKCTCGNACARGRILTKKPITPSQEEIRENPRSRSAKLRAFALQ